MFEGLFREMHVNDLLTLAVDRGASDLHLKAGSYPMMRVRGELTPASQERRLDHDDMQAMAAAVLPTSLRERLEESHDIDLAYSVAGLGRFRCSVFQQRGTIGMSFRVIPMEVMTTAELLLPPVVQRLAHEERGLVLVTGPTGCGKSATLAAIIDEINSSRVANVLTIEDPIEHLYRDKRSLISQREVGTDTAGFAQALRSALRQDPDVVLVGEMRDAETVEMALLAAEAGHLVLSALHTADASEGVARIVGMFPPHRQQQVRLQLAGALKGVISQRLIPRADRKGRVPAVEVMVTTPFIRECIADGEKTALMRGAIAQGTSPNGMQTFDQSMAWLYEQRLIDREEALRWASNPDELEPILQAFDAAGGEMARAGAGPSGTGTRLGQ